MSTMKVGRGMSRGVVWSAAVGISLLAGCGDAPDSSPAPADSTAAPVAAESADAASDVEASANANSPEMLEPAVAEPAEETVAAEAPATESPSNAGATTSAAPGKPAASETLAAPASSPDSEAAAAARFEQELAALQVPPAWLADVTSTWDGNKPWKDARLHIRNLLGKGDDASRREGVKLMWDYRTKGDMGNGHEYGMYLFLGKEPLWAVRAFRERLAETEHEYPPYFDLKALASLYTDRGLFSEAEKLLLNGLDWAPPKPEWLEMRQAEMHDSLGDLYAAWGRLDDAQRHYQESVRLYPLGKPPYGKHLLPRRAKKVQAKLDLLSMRSLAGATLKDGTWKHTALGYSGDVQVSVRIAGGRIDAINIQHDEKIDQGATTIIPQRIVDSQSLAVDGVSGATVTKDAIVTGTLEALRQAGLQ